MDAAERRARSIVGVTADIANRSSVRRRANGGDVVWRLVRCGDRGPEPGGVVRGDVVKPQT